MRFPQTRRNAYLPKHVPQTHGVDTGKYMAGWKK
jgi:hypothetical protein